ncbi:DNA repair protein RadA [Paenibacillus alvei DSM 29]|nr:DNA repair protein RadA [Paenibacillus alvei DSM 29]
MAKVKTKFYCSECGYESPKWMGKCPGCSEWNTMVEERETVVKTAGVHSSLIQTKEKPQSIIHIESGREPRLTTTLSELNRVLGGGLSQAR